MKIRDLCSQLEGKKNHPNQPPKYDIKEVGYQQFDLMDSYDMFAKPHGPEDSESRLEAKSLYSVR